MMITDLQGTTRLSNGVEMPYFGLGVFLASEGPETIHAVEWALEKGYRHFDTAALYNNERSVGEGIRKSGAKREDIFVTTKVWNSDQGYAKTLKAFQRSLDKLQFNYIDLYLVHWPVREKYVDTWKALEELYRNKRIRAIGVSNFLQPQLEDLLSYAEIIPMVNQVEFHPYLTQPLLRNFCVRNGIQFEAWAPLMRGRVQDIPEIKDIAKKYSKSPVQIVLRWNLQLGVVTIPKSVKKERIQSNADIFDFNLSEEEMMIINSLNKSNRIGPDPENFGF
jgi:methylglyoxal/glyoxal reductase